VATTVTLTGEAVAGYAPHRSHYATAATSRTVALGCRPPRPSKRPVVPLAAHVDLKQMQLPSSRNWLTDPATWPPMRRPYRNSGPNPLGSCVPACFGRYLGIASADDKSPAVVSTEQEIEQDYVDACGPGDQGCYLAGYLAYAESLGTRCNGVRHKIGGFTYVDFQSYDLVRAALELYGPLPYALGFREAWSYSSVWGETDSPMIGGHCVLLYGQDWANVYFASWETVYMMPRSVLTNPKYIWEMYALLGQDWYGPDLVAPNGLHAHALYRDLEQVGLYEIPPVTPEGEMTILSGDILLPGQGRTDNAGRHALIMQANGYLTLYGPGGYVWDNTRPAYRVGSDGLPHQVPGGPGGGLAATFQMQGDGNGVLKDRSGIPVWSTGTAGRTGAHMVVQPDGNVVLKDANNNPVWWTGTQGT
jgi:hypothetical protein